MTLASLTCLLLILCEKLQPLVTAVSYVGGSMPSVENFMSHMAFGLLK